MGGKSKKLKFVLLILLVGLFRGAIHAAYDGATTDENSPPLEGMVNRPREWTTPEAFSRMNPYQGFIPFLIQEGIFRGPALAGFEPVDHPQNSSQRILEKRAPLSPLIQVPLGLPEIPVPASNPITKEKIELGRRLFVEKSLSENGQISCSSCHDPEKGFSDGRLLSRGIHGRQGIRHTPTLVNVAYQTYQSWDGRVSSLEDQSIAPLENPMEMGVSIEEVVTRLKRLPDYRQQFQKVFKSQISSENIAQSLASFERTILSGDSPYDQFVAGKDEALNPEAQVGWRLFNGKAHCHLCHQGFNFSDGLFHNLGVGWNGHLFKDVGRYGVTGIFKDRGSFKTPTLRQVSQTAPYMHDGSFPTLEAVIDFYDRGGNPNPHLDVLIQPLHLNLEEKEALVEFLKSLSGPASRK